MVPGLPNNLPTLAAGLLVAAEARTPDPRVGATGGWNDRGGPAPLRLMFRKRLIEEPTLADLVVAAGRRVKAYLPADRQVAWDDVARQALERARDTPTGAWQGQRLDLQRYSGRQHAELELRGVTGCLDLPRGPGPLWPLLAAARWLHVGKGTVMGLGQMEVEKS